MRSIISSSLLALLLLTGCQRNPPGNASAEPASNAVVDAVQFKQGHGLALSEKLKANIGFEVVEVGEQAVSSTFRISLQVITPSGNALQKVALDSPANAPTTEASGWLTANQASGIRPGQTVELRATDPAGTPRTETAIVKRLAKSPSTTLGDYEVVVTTEALLDPGTPVEATFRLPAGDAVTAVPREALLRTVEGWFVYTVNESHFLRTPVKLGAMNEQFAEITDGLYAGDQIVVRPVQTLWMAELQILRGGKSCTCGH